MSIQQGNYMSFFMNTDHASNSRERGRSSYFTPPLPGIMKQTMAHSFACKYLPLFLTLAHVTNTLLPHEICPLLDIRI